MNPGFISLLVLVAIHLFANSAKVLGWVWHGRFLSFASGISFAYVFVDLLPALEKGQPILKEAFGQIIPYFDKHAYLIALFGVLFYYGLHSQSREPEKRVRNFWLSTAGYLLFNFLIGASLSDSRNPDIQPVALFTIALGMHYFVSDHNKREDDLLLYEQWGRWCLAGALFLGYFVGLYTRIPDAIVAIAVSFLAGGVFLNVLRYELPKREQVGFLYFTCGSLLYTAILLGIGEV